MAKILILDIETAPNIAYVWGQWKQNIYQPQWVDKGWILSYAAKWLDEDGIIYEEARERTDEPRLILNLCLLLNEADFIVAHNGQKFDLPKILGAAVKHNLTPPSPYRILDTCLTARKEFGFVSNTLENLCEELDLPIKKGKHKKFPGFSLWQQCLAGNEEAWSELKEYNIDDILSLEHLYLRMRPYFRNHPNVVRTDDEKVRCAKCGSDNIQWRGYYYSAAGLCYRRFVCLDCGGWGRVRFSERDRNPQGRNAS